MSTMDQQIYNLVSLLDGYAEKGGHHLNAAGRSGASGKISAADRACQRLCGQLQQADEGAAG